MVLVYMLYYVRNQHSNVLQITKGYFAYTNNTIKYIVKNLYYMRFLVIYKIV